MNKNGSMAIAEQLRTILPFCFWEETIYFVKQCCVGKVSFSASLYPTGISDSRHKSEHCIPAIPQDNQVQSE